MTDRERFRAVMDYGAFDRVPNHELGVWPQTIERWKTEGLDTQELHWDWFTGEEYFGMDAREFIPIHYGMLPPFESEVLERTVKYEIIRHANGVVTKALIEGTVDGGRMSMDQYLGFPVTDLASFRELTRRYDPGSAARYPAQWRAIHLPRWSKHDHVLVLGRNCSILGFYWRAREWMGTENLSYAWYEQPELMHEMMAFIADFTIEVSRPVLEAGATPDYAVLNEDMSMKNGPLLSPDLYCTYIQPHLKRVVEFFKGHGVRYVMIDTDGDCELLIPPMLDAGVDGVWPLERASGMDPARLRRKFGRALRIWGGVDKRILAEGPAAIDAHLAALAPVVEEGGFIPTVDHTVPPDVPLDHFVYYMERKQALLRGEL